MSGCSPVTAPLRTTRPRLQRRRRPVSDNLSTLSMYSLEESDSRREYKISCRASALIAAVDNLRLILAHLLPPDGYWCFTVLAKSGERFRGWVPLKVSRGMELHNHGVLNFHTVSFNTSVVLIICDCDAHLDQMQRRMLYFGRTRRQTLSRPTPVWRHI
jgi:hypothetical protein